MNKVVIDALKNVGAPVSFQEYTGSATTYITFFFYNEKGVFHAENEELATGHSLQVDIWSTGNYSSLVKEVKTRMNATGFTRTFAADLYEEPSGSTQKARIFHKALRFRYTEFV
ncbi:hypothetical protein [Domibacillus aminovorans]|uniref:Uncharacterized protein n=1 Tax=Domibacillus aminovorans TaxID=29332 RepID=A0A177L625_9BACI|nr:hypothetical protein [Domibacillus aminovorans]OAH60752.1 hypothetical protein AWH49_15545 [Domibacillus aminovorans]